VTVNLAPADLPKEGGRYDLAVALGILAASGQLPVSALDTTEFYGELSLSGELRAVRGVLAAAVQAARDRRRIVVPAPNAEEARVARGARVAGAGIAHDGSQRPLRGRSASCSRRRPAAVAVGKSPDLAEAPLGKQRRSARLEIAAAGVHSLLLIGPPGAGKEHAGSTAAGPLAAARR
jgi:magnesium chelatase family protein